MYRALHTQIILLCAQANRLAADTIEQKAAATPRRRTLISLSAGQDSRATTQQHLLPTTRTSKCNKRQLQQRTAVQRQKCGKSQQV